MAKYRLPEREKLINNLLTLLHFCPSKSLYFRCNRTKISKFTFAPKFIFMHLSAQSHKAVLKPAK